MVAFPFIVLWILQERRLMPHTLSKSMSWLAHVGEAIQTANKEKHSKDGGVTEASHHSISKTYACSKKFLKSVTITSTLALKICVIPNHGFARNEEHRNL